MFFWWEVSHRSHRELWVLVSVCADVSLHYLIEGVWRLYQALSRGGSGLGVVNGVCAGCALSPAVTVFTHWARLWATYRPRPWTKFWSNLLQVHVLWWDLSGNITFKVLILVPEFQTLFNLHLYTTNDNEFQYPVILKTFFYISESNIHEIKCSLSHFSQGCVLLEPLQPPGVLQRQLGVDVGLMGRMQSERRVAVGRRLWACSSQESVRRQRCSTFSSGQVRLLVVLQGNSAYTMNYRGEGKRERERIEYDSSFKKN